MVKNKKTLYVALLLFGSGFCALVYQVVWFRELRLVFGASTAANAAVLAIFMAGLGLGSALLGRRVDNAKNALLFYAKLEFLITLGAFLSPFLLLLVRQLYIAMGGVSAMGLLLSTLVRLFFSALILGLPTFLMGGTLPAAVREVTEPSDSSRWAMAVLYGANTLGAVLGVVVASFYLLESYGITTTLQVACLVNLLVALAALLLCKKFLAKTKCHASEMPSPSERDSAPESPEPSLFPIFVLSASAISGFAFFLLELVWYRMLTPIMGGSTYTFAFILANALFGIGFGGFLYTLLLRNVKATFANFALICALEALFVAFPYLLGDRVAIVAMLLVPFSSIGLSWCFFAWAIIGFIVVFPAAVIAGVQFPLLIALLGKGKENIGRQIGYAYAWNTLGAILGSLAGGFGLLPILTAPDVWVGVVVILGVLSLIAVLLESAPEKKPVKVVLPALLALLFYALAVVQGPGVVWRHTGIGAGRAKLNNLNKNSLQAWINNRRNWTVWEADGVESSVALVESSNLSFYVNGKADGSAKGDASTQIMLGLVSAVLHPKPTSALVIGLGTGSSAGWLGQVGSIKQVDVVEFEPVVTKVALECAVVNHNVLDNPKVNLIFNDAREVLLTSKQNYDLIASEPSNPYRAGIASLYTREFYTAVIGRLSEDGIFSQWIQGYEVDSQTIRTIYATLSSVFPVVETWQTHPADLLFICAKKPLAYETKRLRVKLRQYPFNSALQKTWWVNDLEGFLAHFVADSSFAKIIARQEAGKLNTDDRMRVEYGFARTLGLRKNFLIEDIYRAARNLDKHRPPVAGLVDWESVAYQRLLMHAKEGGVIATDLLKDHSQKQRALALNNLNKGMGSKALLEWKKQKQLLRYDYELVLFAEVMAEIKDQDNLQKVLSKIEMTRPLECDLIRARLNLKLGQDEAAVKYLVKTFIALRTNSWIHDLVLKRAFELARKVGMKNKEYASRLSAALAQPFAVKLLNISRNNLRANLVSKWKLEQAGDLLAEFEPHIPWQKSFLEFREKYYAAHNLPLAEKARQDLKLFLAQESERFNGKAEFSRLLLPIKVD